MKVAQWALAFAFLCCAAPVWAQVKTGPCCNTQTNQLIDVQDVATCNAMPGHLHTNSVDQSNMMELMGCLQNAQRDAMQALQDYQQGSAEGQTAPGQPGSYPGSQINIPALGGGGQITVLDDLMGGQNTVTMDDVPVQCCDIDGARYVGIEPPGACRARGAAFVPELPDTLEETKICRASNTGSSSLAELSGAWDKEDYEPNITHAGMEQWKDEHKPEGFTSWGPDPKLTSKSGLDLQVTFRSPDAHTGQWSIFMKPADILPQLPKQAQGITAATMRTPYLLTPSGFLTCKKPCPAERPRGGGVDGKQLFGSLQSENIKSHVCIAYKGFIGHQDALNIDVAVYAGANTVAAIMNAEITQSSADWKTMAFPLSAVGGQSVPQKGKVGISAAVMPRANGGMPGLKGWDISPFSGVKVDSIHFCGADLIAYHPAVIDEKQMELEEEFEDSEGLQTFVNSDNDDNDRAFDLADTDGVTDDDELIHIRLEMPKNSFGDAELRVVGIDSQIKLWSDARKSEPFMDYNKPMEVLQLLRTTPDGERYARDLWVEAIAPSESQKDIKIDFLFINKMLNDSIFKDSLVVTALAPMKIAFKAQGNAINASDTLDKDENWPSAWDDEALRVFPGKPWEASAPAAEAKNKVTITASLNVAPVRPVRLWMKSFDVDDPNHSDDKVDDETTPSDNRGNDPYKTGHFVDAAKGEPHQLIFDEKEKETDFQVTRQPGDNFRIAISADLDQFDVLENDDTKIAAVKGGSPAWIYDKNILAKTQDPVQAKMARHDELTSPVLTVWRRFYVELDEMEAVNSPPIKGVIQDMRREPEQTDFYIGDYFLPQIRRLKIQWLKLDQNLGQTLPDTSKERYKLKYVKDSWRAATIDIGKTGESLTLKVHRNTANETEDDEIQIINTDNWLSDAAIGLPYELKDDDAWRHRDPIPDVDMSRVEEVFKPAYILPMIEQHQLLPGSSRIPFMLHAVSDQEGDLKKTMEPHFKNQKLDNDPEFWIVYIQNGFQGSMMEDGDGESDSLAGITDNNVKSGKGGYGIFVYQESARELADGKSGPGWRVSDVAPHEIGHLFGGAHSHTGLMGDKDATKSDHFDDETLNLARGRAFP